MCRDIILAPTMAAIFTIHFDLYIERERETLSTLIVLYICEGIDRSLVDSPHKGPVTRALMLACTNCRINLQVASDLGCYDVHCDVIVIYSQLILP